MNSVIHFIKAGGFVMYPLLVLSLVSIGVIVERVLAYRRLGAIPAGLLRATLDLVRGGRIDDALRQCEAQAGPLAACLAVVLRNRRRPVAEIERLVEETGQDYFIRMERLLPVLDTTTTIAPLLGLLGTIVGMTGTFNAISAQTARGGGGTDAILAGVGEALYATATGLTIAVICFVAYNYFGARLRTVTTETEQGATKLLNALAASNENEEAANRGVQTAA